MIALAPPIVIVDEPRLPAPTPGSAHANTPEPARASFTPSTPAGSWASPIEIVPSSGGPVGNELAVDLEVAARTWRAVPCATVEVRVAPARPVASVDDGVLTVVWENVTWPSELLRGAPAQTVLHVEASGRFRDADVHLNAVEFTWSTGLVGASATAGAVDLRGILVHELGHVLGLGHSADVTATMFASTGDAAEWRSLEADDAAGVCFLYPGTAPRSPMCSESAPCPAPTTCVAARCERERDPRSICAPCDRSDPSSCKAQGHDARCVATPSSSSGASEFRCGRPCATDMDCGARFRCEATTEAGDRQCVGVGGCAEGPHRCTADADCKAPAVCRQGSCANTTATDGGPSPLAGDAGVVRSDQGATTRAGGGCAILRVAPAANARSAVLGTVLLSLVAFALRRIRPKRSAPSSAAPRASCKARP